MDVVELGGFTDEQWSEIIGEEIEPWGGGAGERMSWREKDLHLGVRRSNGEVVALAGAVVARVDVEDSNSFDVLGIGGVFVRASERGRGLAVLVLQQLLARAERDSSSPRRAMLFCRAHLTGFYEKLDFRAIEAPVWADQPGARAKLPMPAMWRPLSTGADWPRGRVDVRGLPF